MLALNPANPVVVYVTAQRRRVLMDASDSRALNPSNCVWKGTCEYDPRTGMLTHTAPPSQPGRTHLPDLSRPLVFHVFPDGGLLPTLDEPASFSLIRFSDSAPEVDPEVLESAANCRSCHHRAQVEEGMRVDFEPIDLAGSAVIAVAETGACTYQIIHA